MMSRSILASVVVVLAASVPSAAPPVAQEAPEQTPAAQTPSAVPDLDVDPDVDVDRDLDLDLEGMYADIRRQVDQAVDEEAIVAEVAKALENVDVAALVDGAMQSVDGMMPGRTPRLGVGVRDLTADEAQTAGLDGIRGAWIAEVREDSPAAGGGLAAGDVVVRVDGQDVRSARHLSRLVAETPAGGAIAIEYVRAGQRATATVTPEPGGWAMAAPEAFRWRSDAPGPRAFAFERARPHIAAPLMARGRLGIGVQDLTAQLATYFGVKDGVLVTSVSEGSAAERSGLKAGDVITRVGSVDIGTVRDLTRSLREAASGTEVEVYVSRDREPRTFSVMPDATPTRQRQTVRTRSRSAVQ